MRVRSEEGDADLEQAFDLVDTPLVHQEQDQVVFVLDQDIVVRHDHLIATDDGVKVGAAYEPTEEKIASVSSFVSQTGEDAALRKQTYEESLGWYAGITSDMFG